MTFEREVTRSVTERVTRVVKLILIFVPVAIFGFGGAVFL